MGSAVSKVKTELKEAIVSALDFTKW
jgi:hypothetical protein